MTQAKFPMMLDEERAKYVTRELQYEQTIESLNQQLADSQKREVMLRDGLKRADDLLRTSYDHVSPLIREALAATEPKP